MIEVILCDDHALIRRGIRDTLSDAVDIRVVGEASDYGELRSLLVPHPSRAAAPNPCFKTYSRVAKEHFFILDPLYNSAKGLHISFG